VFISKMECNPFLLIREEFNHEPHQPHEKENAGQHLASQAVTSESTSLTSKLADSPIRTADGPAAPIPI